jgi:hypothetical protein
MDWPIESSPASQAAFKAEIAASSYKSNVYSSLGGTMIVAP